MLDPRIGTPTIEYIQHSNNYTIKYTFNIANDNDFAVALYINGVAETTINANSSYNYVVENEKINYTFNAYFINDEIKTNICPNMRWNNPTFREVLNDLCLTKDCLITLKDNKLTPLNISKYKNEFTSDNITYDYESQSLNDYVSEIRSELGNAVDVKPSMNNKGIGFRNSEVAYFATANENGGGGVKIETLRPIYDLVSIKALAPVGNTVKKVDMTNYVKEKGVFDTLLQGYDYSGEDPVKKNCMYYTRGQNNIVGATNKTQEFWVGTSVLDFWIGYINRETGVSVNSNELKFELEYISIDTQEYTMSCGTNYHRRRNFKQTIDNQDSSSIEIEKFINFESYKLKRLGNNVVLSKLQQSTNINDLPQVLQTYNNNNVIFSKTLILNRHSFDTEFYSTRDYAMSNYFVSMNSQKRNFERIDIADSVKRLEPKKVYYELSFDSKDDIIKLDGWNANITSDILNGSDNDKMIKLYACSPFFDNDNLVKVIGDDPRTLKIETFNTNTQLQYSELLNVESNLQCLKNIVSYNFQLDDNQFYKYAVEWETHDLGFEDPVTAFYNNDGINYNADTTNNTFDKLCVKLGGHKKLDEIVNFGGSDEEVKDYSHLLPRNYIDEKQTSEGYSQVFTLPYYKDGGEKLGLSLNFEWVSDNEDIEILNPAINSLYNKENDKAMALYFNDMIYWYDIDGNELSQEFGFRVTNDLKGIYYSNGKFYNGKSKTQEIVRVQLGTYTNMYKYSYMFVYDLDQNKLYAELLDTLPLGAGIEIKDKIEIKALEVRFGIFSDFTPEFDTIYTINYFNDTLATIGEATYPEPSFDTTQPLLNITNGTGTIDLDNCVLEITPTDTNIPITINDSIRIKNVASHLIDGKVKIYLIIKNNYL